MIDPLPGLAVLEEVSNIVESVDQSLYEDFETVARERVTPCASRQIFHSVLRQIFRA
jgi:hypothetical protein